MNSAKLDVLERALARERAARKQAEKILEQKSAELFSLTKELKKSNTKLERLVRQKTLELKGVFENIIDAYVVMDLNGEVLKMNDAAQKMLGFSLKEGSVNLASLVHPKDADTVPGAFQKLYQENAITNYQVTIITKNKETKLVDINASIIFDENDTPIAAQGIVRDITKEKEAEAQLKESENRLATIIRNWDSGVLLENEQRRIVITNNKICELFSIPASPEALQGGDCEAALEASKAHFVNPEAFISRVNDILEKRVLVQADELTMTNGTILERDYIPIFEDEIYRGHLWTYRDVTPKRRYRQNIEAQKQKYSDIIANMNLGLVEVDNDDKIIMVNNSFEVMSGYKESELIGKEGKEVLLHEDYKDQITIQNDLRLKGESNSYEVLALTKGGEKKHWLISGAPNFDIKGNVIGSIGIHLDITKLKTLESQKESLLKKLEKSNEELQEYAHIVSHDLKSPLRSINALVNWIKEDNNNLNEETLHNISLIDVTLEKMEQLISDVLDYSSVVSEDSQHTSVNLNEVVQNIEQLIMVPDHIELTVVNTLPTITANRARVQQLFQNLIGNAIRYIDKDKGSIEVGVKELTSYYEFYVKDNGIGIAPEYHEKIFKIFQSLNKHKESTGIGLSIVKKIVTMNQGEIWLDSALGKGTVFYFTLKKQ